MDNFVGWPAYQDDDGSLSVGTVTDTALLDAIRASLADNVYSLTNPAVKTKTIIDEVIAARGTSLDLDQRLGLIDVSVAAILGPRILYRQTINLNSQAAGESGVLYSMPANTFATDGQQIEVTASGAMANNANAKSLKLYVGTNFLTVMIDNAAIASNQFTLRGLITRISGSSVVFDGIVTFHAASAAPPTVWHLNAALAGGATNLSTLQDVKLYMLTPIANADMTLVRTNFRLWQ